MTIEQLISDLLEVKKTNGQQAVWDYIDQLAIEADKLVENIARLKKEKEERVIARKGQDWDEYELDIIREHIINNPTDKRDKAAEEIWMRRLMHQLDRTESAIYFRIAYIRKNEFGLKALYTGFFE